MSTVKYLKKVPSALMIIMFLAFCSPGPPGASASVLVPQTPLAGADIPKFQDPLPVFGPAGAIPRVQTKKNPNITVTMEQISQQVLPAGYGATKVWAYRINDTYTKRLLGPAHWPAVTVENLRYHPTKVKYVNNLPSFSTNPNSIQGSITVDQTLHWADPLNLMCAMNMSYNCTTDPNHPCCQPYTGPVPATVHLHGGEVHSIYDGGPDSWFTPGFAYTGTSFATNNYVYLNTQEPGALWFHDHALGITRINVYSGLAAFYLLRGTPGKDEPQNLPSGTREIEIAIQDRMFDTNGQLFFSDAGINPDMHPFWTPENFGDVIVVNGKSWPYLNVKAQRYRFRILNGSNARFYNLNFGAAQVWQIGWEENYLDSPVAVSSVFIAPGERADVIVDFAPAAGTTFAVTNDANAPFPDGDAPDPATNGQIIQFRVGPALATMDTTCNPALGQCERPVPIVRLAQNGSIAPGVRIHKKRQLTLNEIMGMGGPLEMLLNNTKWNGMMSPGIAQDFAATKGISELPVMGATEEWEIMNLTADTHPIHTHLVQFQLLDRQAFDPASFQSAYDAAFPGGAYIPEYGPPNPYLEQNSDNAIGGNPSFSQHLMGDAVPASELESGWKDTIKMNPREVTRILVRFSPTDVPVSGVGPGKNAFEFDPTRGPGYVWHCHIVDHEDNEMMRPFKIIKR